MADFFDYLKWRGDLSFCEAPFNDIDAAVLCQISYLNLKGIARPSFRERMALVEIASEFAANDFENRSKLGLLINPKTVDLLFDAAQSKRFGEIEIGGYVDVFKPEIETQFSAETFFLDDGSLFVAFRGTDDTIIGWKEDFNLGFKAVVPAQEEALSYLNSVIKETRSKNIIIGGHSKGGNLAVFSAANIGKKNLRRIQKVYNLDGPGFPKEKLESEDFKAALQKTRSIYPKGSFVGMIFEHDDEFFVTESSGAFIAQHDCFTWDLCGGEFTEADGLEKFSEFFNKTFNEWFVKLEESKREEFVEILFSALNSTKATTNSELAANWIKNTGHILKALNSLDRSVRKSASETVKQFIRLAGKNFPSLIKG